jgi:uncharacterized protein (TIGR02246 family)
MMKLGVRSVVLSPLVAAALLSLGGCSSTPPVNLAAEEKAIRAVEADFAKAVAAKDLDKSVSFYAEDAALLNENEATAVGKSAIRAFWTSTLAMPNLALTWAVDKVQVAAGGDLAYDYGNYKMSYTGPSGKKVSDVGKYATIWKKQADGNWKAVLDTSNTDQPAAQPGAAKKAQPKRKKR